MDLRKIYGKKEPASFEVWLSISVPFLPPHHFLSVHSMASCQVLCRLHVLFFLAYRGLLCPRPFVVGEPGPLHVELPQTTSNASVTPGPAAPTFTSCLCPSSSPPTPARLGLLLEAQLCELRSEFLCPTRLPCGAVVVAHFIDASSSSVAPLSREAPWPWC